MDQPPAIIETVPKGSVEGVPFLKDFPPPVLYDFPYTGPGNLIVVPHADVVCYDLGLRSKVGAKFYGCSWFTAGGCLIVLPKVEGSITQARQDMVRRAENANCNGWPKGERE
jgi:hypothetical protein